MPKGRGCFLWPQSRSQTFQNWITTISGPGAIAIGNTYSFTGNGYNGLGQPIGGYGWWMSSDPTIATVAPLTGSVAALTAGAVDIMASWFDRDGNAHIPMQTDPAGPTQRDWFYDPVSGDDTWDATSATFVSGTIGPRKNLFSSVSGVGGVNSRAADAETGIVSGHRVVVVGTSNVFIASTSGWIPRSGGNGNPPTIYQTGGGVKGAGVTIIAGIQLDNISGGWSNVSGNVWQCALGVSPTSDAYDQCVIGLRAFIRDTSGPPSVDGHFFYNGSGTLQVNRAAGSPSGVVNSWWCGANNGGSTWICARSNNTVFQGFNFYGGKETVRPTSTGGTTLYTYLHNCCIAYSTRRNWWIDRASVTWCMKGCEWAYSGNVDANFNYAAGAAGSWYSRTIDTTSFAALCDNNSATIQIDNCWVHHHLQMGFSHQPSTDNSGTGYFRYSLIEYCGTDGCGVGSAAKGPLTFDFRYNQVRYTCRNGCDRSGLHTFCDGVTCYWNWFHDNGSLGGSDGQGSNRTNADTTWGNGMQFDTASHGCIAKFNLCTNNKLGGLTYISSDACIFQNNTSVGNATGLANTGGVACNGITAQNNRLHSNNVGWKFNNINQTSYDTVIQFTTGTRVVNYNMYGSTVSNKYDASGAGGGTSYSSFATWQGTGFDANGISATPVYTDTTFYLPALNDPGLGVAVSLSDNDGAVRGARVDVGWVEQGSFGSLTVTAA